MKKIISMILCAGVLTLPINAFAAEMNNEFLETPKTEINLIWDDSSDKVGYSNPTLALCDLGVGIASNGISITYITRATENADEIGIKDLVLQEKTTLGWKNISIGTRREYNTERCAGSMVYTGAIKGKTYRVSGTHYAKFGGTEKTLSTVTEEIVFN